MKPVLPVLTLNFFYKIMLLFILSSFFPFLGIILKEYCRKIKESNKKGKKKRKKRKKGRKEETEGGREKEKEGREEGNRQEKEICIMK